MTIFKIAARTVLVLLIIGFISEVVVRIFYKDKLRIWSEALYQPDSILGYRLIPNSHGVIQKIAYSRSYTANSKGFPGPDFSETKPKGKYRVMIVGVSDEAGLNTNGPLNFVNILTDSFKRTDPRIEVINLSLGGGNAGIRNVKLVEGECLKYDPDLVLFKNEFPFIYKKRYRTSYDGILINYPDVNVNIDSAKTRINNNIINKPWRIRLYDNVYLYRLYVQYCINHKEKNKFIKWISRSTFEDDMVLAYSRKNLFWLKYKGKWQFSQEYSVKESIDILKGLTEKLSAKKIRFVVFDTYKEPKSEYYKDIFYKNSIRYLSLDIPFKKEYSFGEIDAHSTQKGHIAIAKTFFKALNDSILYKGNGVKINGLNVFK